MSKFTPGPWKVSDTYGIGVSIEDSRGVYLGNFDSADVRKQARQNAMLAAAAPRLYEALDDCIKVFNVKKVDPLQAFYAIEKARAALAAADGKE